MHVPNEVGLGTENALNVVSPSTRASRQRSGVIRISSIFGVDQFSPSKQPRMAVNMPLDSTERSFRAQSALI